MMVEEGHSSSQPGGRQRVEVYREQLDETQEADGGQLGQGLQNRNLGCFKAAEPMMSVKHRV